MERVLRMDVRHIGNRATEAAPSVWFGEAALGAVWTMATRAAKPERETPTLSLS